MRSKTSGEWACACSKRNRRGLTHILLHRAAERKCIYCGVKRSESVVLPTKRGIMQKGVAVLAVLALVAFAACSFVDVNQDSNQAQGITNPSDPASPGAGTCSIGSLRPGSAGDVREIAQGATVAIGVELLGTQGLPLPSSCLGQYTPAWTGGAPCVLSGAGYDMALSAPASAPLDSICSASVTVGGKTGSVSLRVVP